MTLLIGAVTIGLILSLLALGVFISFRIFEFPDITADGSITLGAALASILIVRGVHPVLATGAALLGGAFAGTLTGVIHTRFGINKLLSGILVMTALYSVNLHVMGKSNVPLLSERTLATLAERGVGWARGSTGDLEVWGWSVGLRDAGMLAAALLAVTVVGLLLYAFFKTNLGTAMQAAGDNPQMIRALGVNVEHMIVLGLTLSNGLVALSGALLAQYQGFADVQMGIGMVVWGLASIIIGEALVGVRQLGFIITGAVLGSVLFRLLVAIALRGGLNPNDLKLVTAAFVFAALILPAVLTRLGTSSRRGRATPAVAPQPGARV
jgi:putative tryptophan/tyrosine transport system permease protein